MVIDVKKKQVIKAHVDLSHGCHTVEIAFNQESDGDPGKEDIDIIWKQACLISELIESEDLITDMCFHKLNMEFLRLNLYGYVSRDKKDLSYMLSQLQCTSLHLNTNDFIPDHKNKIMAKVLHLDFSRATALDYMESISKAFPGLESLTLNLKDNLSLHLQGASFPNLTHLTLKSSFPLDMVIDFISLNPGIQRIVVSLDPELLSRVKYTFPQIKFIAFS
ncbi:hypothetical protein DSO57_1027001 [Entomophthora muscae]|uniref:Uncharacterized protein n=1 Tax=Entomophthora muscae TaxID=34485 RepID=A0ACC2TP43_9FUNG|nr:hypothetical protein DSO57_1027001 [Entomophthora muscae]